MSQLLVAYQQRSVHLHGAVHLWTPRAVLDEGLHAVPSLAVFVLQLRQVSHSACLYASAVVDREVALLALLAALGGNDDGAVGSAAAIECSGGSTLQHGH